MNITRIDYGTWYMLPGVRVHCFASSLNRNPWKHFIVITGCGSLVTIKVTMAIIPCPRRHSLHMVDCIHKSPLQIRVDLFSKSMVIRTSKVVRMIIYFGTTATTILPQTSVQIISAIVTPHNDSSFVEDTAFPSLSNKLCN